MSIRLVSQADSSAMEISGNYLYINGGTALGPARPIKAVVQLNPARVQIITEAGQHKTVQPYDIDLSPLLDLKGLAALLFQGQKLGLSQMSKGDIRVYLKGMTLGGGDFSIDPATTSVAVVLNKLRTLLKEDYSAKEEKTEEENKYVWKVTKAAEKATTITLELTIEKHKYETTIDLKSREDQGKLGDELSGKVESELSLDTTDHAYNISMKQIEKTKAEEKAKQEKEEGKAKTDEAKQKVKTEKAKTEQVEQQTKDSEKKNKAEIEILKAEKKKKDAETDKIKTDKWTGIASTAGGITIAVAKVFMPNGVITPIPLPDTQAPPTSTPTITDASATPPLAIEASKEEKK